MSGMLSAGEGWRSLTAAMTVFFGACQGQETPLPWVASMRGELVYSSACPSVAEIAEKERIYFRSRAQAEGLGYRPAPTNACTKEGRAGREATDSSARSADRSAARLDSTPKPSKAQPGNEARLGAKCALSRVIDGDTFICATGDRVRLLLIDTPERSQDPYGALASGALENLLSDHREVELELDVQTHDRWRRVLAYAWLADGRMVNEEMARGGWAEVSVHPPNVRYVERIRAAVAEARTEGIGLWSTPAFECSPRAHRRNEC